MRYHALVAVMDELLTSSSSDESDLDDIIDKEPQPITPIPRVHFFVENVVAQYSDEEFCSNFRLRRGNFDYLLFLLRDQLGTAAGFGNECISSEKQLLIALWILGIPDSYRSVTCKFAVANATAWKCTFKVVKTLCNFRNYFIQWPSNAEAKIIENRIRLSHEFPGVIGAVDGTHINIAAPKEDANSYVNRKEKHSIQLQVICDDTLKFTHCYVGMPGSVHDMRVFKYSGMQDHCTEQFFPRDSHLLGDAAYTLQNILFHTRIMVILLQLK